MSAVDQSPVPGTAQATAVQARLDHLFRHHVRGNEDDAATGALRSLMEQYRLQGQGQAGVQS